MILRIIVTIFFILSFAVLCFAQQIQKVEFNSGTLSRRGYNHIPIPADLNFNFRFLGPDTDVNGGLFSYGGGMSLTESRSDCCLYGKRFVLGEVINGGGNFRHTGESVVVNGTTYNNYWYRGELYITGATIVPFYLKKRQNQQINVPITTTGYIQGYETLSDWNMFRPMFSTSLSMTGFATIMIRRHDGWLPENHFDVISVKYNLVPQ